MESEATRCDGPAEIKVLIPPAVDAPQRARHQVDALGVPAPAPTTSRCSSPRS